VVEFAKYDGHRFHHIKADQLQAARRSVVTLCGQDESRESVARGDLFVQGARCFCPEFKVREGFYAARSDQRADRLHTCPRAEVGLDRQLRDPAMAEGNPPKDQTRVMLRSLLADRFHLQVHTVTAEGAVIALIPARPGATRTHITASFRGPAMYAVGVFPPACDELPA
jgi:hypothetical protein